jgi:hypothetical protein
MMPLPAKQKQISVSTMSLLNVNAYDTRVNPVKSTGVMKPRKNDRRTVTGATASVELECRRRRRRRASEPARAILLSAGGTRAQERQPFHRMHTHTAKVQYQRFTGKLS